MIEGLDFVYYGPMPWAGMWRNRHQLLSRLARRNRVVYLEPLPYLRALIQGWRSRTIDASGLRTGGLHSLSENLWYYQTPAYAAIGGGPIWRPVARRMRVAHLRRALREVGMTRPVVWLSHPGQVHACDDLPARLRVYHVVDEYLAYTGVDAPQRARLAAWEEQVIAWADLVITVTPELAAAKDRGQGKTRLLPNAADLSASDAGRARPIDLGLPRPVLGYAGLISARLNLPALTRLAGQRPDWSLALVGEVAELGCEAELAALRGRPNVHFVGLRPAAEVPGLIAGWDVGLIPYRVNEETKHVSPLKLYEYLATGLPVVSADVPAVRPFAEVVSIIQDADDFAAAIERALAGDSTQAREARRAAAQPHSWDARVDVLSQMLAEALASVDE